MLHKILNPIFQVGLFLLFLILLWSSAQVIINNFRYINVIKTGKIIGIEHVIGSQSDGFRGTYDNKILTDKENQIVYGGTQEMYQIGDSVTLRYTGKVPSRIFKINGKEFRSKYGIWDWISPFLFVFCFFMLYKFIRMWILRLRSK